MAGLAALTLLGGCSTGGSDLQPDGRADVQPDPVASSFAALPDAVACGSVTAGPGTDGPALTSTSLDCARAALAAGRTVAVDATSATIEGDPITTHYRVRPTGPIDVWVDSSKDAHSNRRWSRRTEPCPGEHRMPTAQLCALR